MLLHDPVISQSVASLTADPGVESSIPARSHTFVDIDHENLSHGMRFPTMCYVRPTKPQNSLRIHAV